MHEFDLFYNVTIKKIHVGIRCGFRRVDMNINRLLGQLNEMENSRKSIKPVRPKNASMRRALELTSVLNSGYHSQEEIQDVFSELTGQDVRGKLVLYPPFYADCGKNIRIGGKVTIGPGVSVQGNALVAIGDGTQIGRHVTISSGDGSDGSSVMIGENVRIGSGVRIMKGVRIGDNAVIAAGALVNRDIEPNTVAIGSPVHVISHPARQAAAWS